MVVTLRLLVILTMALMPALAQAQQDQEDALPRVLILGDHIYNQTSRAVAAELKDKAQVVYATSPRGEVFNSSSVLEGLGHLLGRVDRNGESVPQENWPSWDLIHINVGLGDLIYRAPQMKSFRVLPIHAGGVVTTPPKAYEKNLDALIRQLQAEVPDATLVWASTTPIRHSTSNVFEMGSEVAYNQIAARVMSRHGVPMNDMYSYGKSLLDMDQPAPHGWDPMETFRRTPIHMPIVRVIEKAFGLPPMPETQEEEASKKKRADPQSPAQSSIAVDPIRPAA